MTLAAMLFTIGTAFVTPLNAQNKEPAEALCIKVIGAFSGPVPMH
jgi:hypothetical protein